MEVHIAVAVAVDLVAVGVVVIADVFVAVAAVAVACQCRLFACQNVAEIHPFCALYYCCYMLPLLASFHPLFVVVAFSSSLFSPSTSPSSFQALSQLCV